VNGREQLVRLRLVRARETLAEAQVLARAEHWNGCVNRLYYACFYAVTALLLSQGLAASKHSGVLSLFNRHFVKAGTVDREMGRFYNDLFQNRQRGDYEDLVRFDEARVMPWLAAAQRFIAQIEMLVESAP
jgi:uncharacterized protein